MSWVPLLPGATLALGLVLALAGIVPRPPHLADALARLDGREPARTTLIPRGKGGRDLALRGVSPADLRREQILLALVFAVVATTAVFAVSMFVALPLEVAVGPTVLVGGAAGFAFPVVVSRAGAREATHDAAEALFTYFDLVTLERLANRSASQALWAAAEVSDAAVFRRIREALERARMEQQPPFAELRRAADELNLPALADLAAVMRLDESGASLSGTLRARVRELRNAHVNATLAAAHTRNERLTFWMAIPALVFALIFLTPPLLQLVGTA